MHPCACADASNINQDLLAEKIYFLDSPPTVQYNFSVVLWVEYPCSIETVSLPGLFSQEKNLRSWRL